MKNVFKLFGIAAIVAVIAFAVSATFAACDDGTASLIPADPKGLKASVSGNQVTLTWKAASGATWYEVTDSSYSNFSNWSGVRATTTTTRAVITLTSYDAISDRIYFRVKAVNSYGGSRGYSNVVSVRIR